MDAYELDKEFQMYPSFYQVTQYRRTDTIMNIADYILPILP